MVTRSSIAVALAFMAVAVATPTAVEDTATGEKR